MSGTGGSPRALVVGLGISGIAAAIRLRQVGWEPVIVERAPQRRAGGYFIMLFGSGVASARRLGVLDAIGDRGGEQVRSWEVDRSGWRRPGMAMGQLAGGPRPLLRGDVENGLFSMLPDDVEIRFSTVPDQIEQEASGAKVVLRDLNSDTLSTETFDLVIGADGLHSTVRRLAFGDQSFLRPLNYMIAATLLDRPVDGFGLSEGLVLSEPGRSVTAFPFRDHAPSLLMTYRTRDPQAELARKPIEALRAAFGPEPAGDLLDGLFDRYEQASSSLFDSVQQVRMPSWYRGRVVLLGDAAWCLTLYSGMGASSGIAGAEVLGTMLERHPGKPSAALWEWERHMRPFIAGHQASALADRRIFVAQDRREHLMRAGMMRLMQVPVARRAMGRMMANNKSMAAKNVDMARA
ncbi:FAD-dependent monooxygenase [Kineosporia babensis]|uniref:FAD-dependent monooxygenase n=1 Tax=Kineosporia babensis TaxID=499548 RepID=A0A9X1NKG6_9ACTN|nr:FAD-dependent monooxygenase [Kineosporia babensis]